MEGNRAPTKGKPPKFDHLVKLIMVGDKSVGKTCLVKRYFDESFQGSNLSTIGMESKTKRMDMLGK
mgnify:CR=1 FL=1